MNIPKALILSSLASLGALAQSFDPQLAPNPDYSLFQRENPRDRESVGYILRKLINNPSPAFFMAVAPCFDAPYSIVLSQRKAAESGGAQYTLKYAVLIKAKSGRREIRRKTADLPLESAIAIRNAWEDVIRNAEYPDKPDPLFLPVDNDTYFFYSDPGLAGMTYSGRVPIVLLGKMLIQYVNAPSSDRANHLTELIRSAREISKAQKEFRDRRSKP